MAIKPIPEGFHTVTPYILANGASQLIDFVKQAFGATEIMRQALPNGAIMHAQVKIGDSIIMISDAKADYPPMPSMLYLYVKDADSVYKKALEVGGISLMEPADQFYGDRNAGIKDQFGNQWWVATHIKDVTEEELAEGAKKYRNK